MFQSIVRGVDCVLAQWRLWTGKAAFPIQRLCKARSPCLLNEISDRKIIALIERVTFSRAHWFLNNTNCSIQFNNQGHHWMKLLAVRNVCLNFSQLRNDRCIGNELTEEELIHDHTLRRRVVFPTSLSPNIMILQ